MLITPEKRLAMAVASLNRVGALCVQHGLTPTEMLAVILDHIQQIAAVFAEVDPDHGDGTETRH